MPILVLGWHRGRIGCSLAEWSAQGAAVLHKSLNALSSTSAGDNHYLLMLRGKEELTELVVHVDVAIGHDTVGVGEDIHR